MKHGIPFACRANLMAAFCVAAATLPGGAPASAQDRPRVEKDGTIHAQAFDLPESSFLSSESRAALQRARERLEERIAASKTCPSMEGADRAQMAQIRKCQAEAFYKTAGYKRVREVYKVNLTAEKIGGVYSEIFTPAAGIAPANDKRVLINLHGGGFGGGARTISHLESAPIAALGRIKVVSVDYRQGPEYTFPAASEDAAAVYRELLKTYPPKNIGIYGCSAGGVLTAQTVAWLQKEKLPLPGGVGMFCAAGAYWSEGDTGHIGAALAGNPLGTAGQNPYLKGADLNDPLVFPARSDKVLAKFPPSLLMVATRDFALSSVVYTHSRLVALGVDADLHVWEGLGHAFFFDPDLPESREAHAVVVKFFDKHLEK